ncbi:helix-turn-helix transcriptional regulator [Haloferax volcanii]|uniref:Helix-turn-helix transcriptional regulator n=1 Tax=Haloferax volcanii TaxID=2246 RepID=A0A558GA76_HALVO|nr:MULTISPECIES: helix-turn-helix domain-containing protein [Haloferax]QIB78814.1 helix-turn-helix transcriptional regulator [Haloferax alexandrinus]TVT94649.1 helix-turn-helix transcriptional regulator [Haloferax volcanii]
MSSKSTDKADSVDIDPYLKEQNEGIFNAFANEEHTVLTTPEIEQHVDLGGRQVRRRLDKLEDEGIVGSRKPGRTKLWWLRTEVEEPVSAKYPIIRLVQNTLSLQFVFLGLLVGGVGVIFMSVATVLMAYNLSLPSVLFLPSIPTSSVIQWGLLSSLLAAGFLIAGGSIAAVNWILDYIGIEISYSPDGD